MSSFEENERYRPRAAGSGCYVIYALRYSAHVSDREQLVHGALPKEGSYQDGVRVRWQAS